MKIIVIIIVLVIVLALIIDMSGAGRKGKGRFDLRRKTGKSMLDDFDQERKDLDNMMK